MPYVYSTATSDIRYTEYHKGPATESSARLKRTLLIKGGANLAPLTGLLITPKGVATKVTDEELDFLNSLESFKRHLTAGFMFVDKAEKDPNKVAAAGMASQDRSAPITPASKDVLGTAIPVTAPAPASRRA